jgi:hypothetical protein
MESIRAGQLQEHVDYLADDELEGREAGSRGGREAGSYVAARAAGLGLRGAGTDGYYQPFSPNYRNVLAMLEGSDRELRGEYVLVAAHYDHVGYGTRRNSRGPVGYIHNGADDNASGVSGLLELAEAFAMLPQPPRRSVLFAAWDAEEKGLLGSTEWRTHPTLPLDKVVYAVTMDMIGSLRNDQLTVYGSRTGYRSRRMLSLSNQVENLMLDFDWSLKPSGDHYPIFERNIPVLLFHTGLHDHYHTPRDDADRINAAGMQRVIRLMFGFIYELANADRVPRFRPAARLETEATRRELVGQTAKRHPRLGASWSPRPSPGPGLSITRVVPGSAADQAGLKPGDRVLQLDGREIGSSDEFVGAVALAEPPAILLVQQPHGDAPVELPVQLQGEPVRLGVTWRLDDAEPGTIILTDVVPGTPAALAGLRVGDRIYQIADRDFADEAEFAELAATLPGPLRLLVERDGQVRRVVLHFPWQTVRRAA